MGAWSLYFFAKLALYSQHAMGLHVWANLAFAAALSWPLTSAAWRRARSILAMPVAMVLLYWDSYLPSWEGVRDRAVALIDFRASYLLELLQRVVSVYWLAGCAALVLAYVFLSHRIRFATWVFVGLIAAALLPTPGPPAPAPTENIYVRAGEPTPPTEALSALELDNALAAYLESAQGKVVSFSRAGPAQFDIVLLSICSLSKDDLDVVHMRDDPFLRRFDIVFGQFNSAATYSGPAVLRLLHSTCGQTAQRDLYSGTASDDCYLFRNLAAAGYRPALLLNHDGRFGNFAEQLRVQGGAGADPLDNRYGAVVLTSFDGTPVRSDFELLSGWWREHQRDEGHNALLYNSITLHDGVRAPGLSNNSLESYAPRLRRLFSDLGRFLDLIEASGRPTAVVLIPEHGAALRGDASQVSGLREIPTPAITTVPAAVRLVGFEALARGAEPLVIDAPASYLSLAALLAGLQQSGVVGTTRESLRALAGALPPVQWVAENENTVFMRQAGRGYLRSPNGQWTPFGEAGTPPP